ncbi:MAG TPA: Ger(x)C family spore germination protein [Bacillota bacterium]|mgnify:FL=1|nr:Ger(x)C family spore germination protein [Bacillota bacterium]
MRKLSLVLIICIIAAMLSSCYDSNEVDDLLHVNIIGIERGVSDKWRLTIKFSTLKGNPGGGSGSGGGNGGESGQEDYTSLTVDAPSLFAGIDMLNSSVSRRLNFMHTEVLVISEDLAESGMLGEFLAPIIRFRQIRRSMHVFVTNGSAMNAINTVKPLVGTALSKNLQIMVKEGKITGYIPHSTLQSFYDQMKSAYRQPTVILAALSNPKNLKINGEKWGNKFKTGGEYYADELPVSRQNVINLFGTAVFDGDKMVGKLTGEETRLMQMATGEFRMGFFTTQDPKEPSLVIPLDVRQAKKPKIIIRLEGDKPIIHLKVMLEGDILAVQSRINYEKPELMPVLERSFEKQIKDGLDKLMEKCIGFKTDIFGFGQTAARQFLTIQEWEKYNWVKNFQNAKITTEVKFTIKRTGTQLKTSPIITTKGKE